VAKSIAKLFLQFSQQSLGISKRNFTNILAILCANNDIIINQLAYCVLKL